MKWWVLIIATHPNNILYTKTFIYRRDQYVNNSIPKTDEMFIIYKQSNRFHMFLLLGPVLDLLFQSSHIALVVADNSL